VTANQGAPEEKPIGQVSHYFSRAGVAAIELTDRLTVGQRIHIRGHTTDFIAEVQSMQIEHEQVAEAGPGASIGVKVSDKVRPGDLVYLAK
jgi:translation elongation factor EF-1alpha